MENGVSTIKFGAKIKLSVAAKEEITLRCLPNMSVLAAYMQVNLIIKEMESVINYFSSNKVNTFASFVPQKIVSSTTIQDEGFKQYLLKYLQEADFNISDVISTEKTSKLEASIRPTFQHKVQGKMVNLFIMSSLGDLNQMGHFALWISPVMLMI